MSSTTSSIDKSNERVRKMFGEIAPKYDRMNHVLSMNVDRYWRWQTVRRVSPQGCSDILDLCTGTGDLALAFQKKAPPEAQITAADFCEEMLDIGRVKAQRRQVSDQVTFVTADAQELPFADEAFDIVSVAFGLRNVADTDRGLREMVRVCRPGGRLAVLEFSMPTRQPVKGVYRFYFRHILPRIGQWFARNSEAAYEYLPATVAEFPSGQELADRMLTAGLKRVDFHPLTFGLATLYVGVK